ncbi:MAG: hypothetical protein WC794_04615 [Candidatus Doudnabacteria bacterium]|jgi:hypothetical protein
MKEEFGSSWGDYYTEKYGEMNGPAALNLVLDIIDTRGAESIDGYPERDKIIKAICLMTDADLVDWSNGGKRHQSDGKKIESFERRFKRARGLRDAFREKINFKNIPPKIN